jgi:release factor glutamine methyltransferase
MYAPAEDSFFLIECAKNYHGRSALEIGIGSGVVAQTLLANFLNVVGTDINLESLAICKGKGIMLICCDAASALCGKFDLVVTNPPYLPGDPKLDATILGGPAGMETTMRFIESAIPLLSEKGRILVLVSSLADSTRLNKFVQEKKLKKRIVAEKALFYERLYAIELTF